MPVLAYKESSCFSKSFVPKLIRHTLWLSFSLTDDLLVHTSKILIYRQAHTYIRSVFALPTYSNGYGTQSCHYMSKKRQQEYICNIYTHTHIQNAITSPEHAQISSSSMPTTATICKIILLQKIVSCTDSKRRSGELA